MKHRVTIVYEVEGHDREARARMDAEGFLNGLPYPGRKYSVTSLDVQEMEEISPAFEALIKERLS